MKKTSIDAAKKAISHSRLLISLRELALEIADVGFTLVFPGENGWDQVVPGTGSSQPEFCRIIQRTEAGSKQCKMCHVLMSVAANSKGLTEQLCHAHVSVLTVPVGGSERTASAIISTCAFVAKDQKKTWAATKARGKELGTDLAKLEKAYEHLPTLDSDAVRQVLAVMRAAGEAAKEIADRVSLEEELSSVSAGVSRESMIRSVVEDGLRCAVAGAPSAKRSRAASEKSDRTKSPVLVDVVSELVGSRPHMPFSVTDIAAAARMTPNHFSTLFRKHKGISFIEFVTERRIEAAKKYLCDFTMNIGEVAQQVGYDDPGYFSRIFKKKLGLTPREWRESMRTESAGR